MVGNSMANRLQVACNEGLSPAQRSETKRHATSSTSAVRGAIFTLIHTTNQLENVYIFLLKLNIICNDLIQTVK